MTKTRDEHSESKGPGSRRLFIILATAAMLYAFLAGFYTLTSFDLGWQLATGHWIVHHHQIPSTDVFSYTAHGQPWIYPVASSLIFYGLNSVGGYALLTWLGALVCVGTVTILLRRGSTVSVALSILAIPLIAARTSPRADMFTVLLFAAFLSILWQHLQTGKARLWVLPVIMAGWVNLHTGFISGIALLIAYGGVELIQMLGRKQRFAARTRLRAAVPWLATTLLATLFNPWGWTLYRTLFRQEEMMGLHSQQINEWIEIPLSRMAFLHSLSIHRPDAAIYVVLMVTIVAFLSAIAERNAGSALLLLIAGWFAMRHLRFEALFACVVVVVGAPVVSFAISRISGRLIQDRKVRVILAAGVTALLFMFAAARSIELVSNRYYFGTSGERRAFGTGLSWWFPERAAQFIHDEKLPGKLFNSYNEGGFVIWRLGPSYEDYIDGRAIPFGAELFAREKVLMQALPDGLDWQQEANARQINTVLIALGRYDGLELFPFPPSVLLKRNLGTGISRRSIRSIRSQDTRNQRAD